MVSRLLPIVVIAALVPVVPAAAAEWSCKVHHEVYPTPCTTQHHRCPDFTDKNGDGICDNCVEVKGQTQGGASSVKGVSTGQEQHRFSPTWFPLVLSALLALGAIAGRRA